MREVPPHLVTQEETGLACRWFTGPGHDLFVWTDTTGDMVRFQFCTGRGSDTEETVDWSTGGPLTHGSIDDGETPTLRMTPLVLKNGPWSISDMRDAFARASGDLPQGIRDAIWKVLSLSGD